jgi:hypothetical protein
MAKIGKINRKNPFPSLLGRFPCARPAWPSSPPPRPLVVGRLGALPQGPAARAAQPPLLPCARPSRLPGAAQRGTQARACGRRNRHASRPPFLQLPPTILRLPTAVSPTISLCRAKSPESTPIASRVFSPSSPNRAHGAELEDDPYRSSPRRSPSR